MQVVVDIECDGLVNPSKIWCVVCKDIHTGELYVFRNLTEDRKERDAFLAFAKEVKTWVGHNWLGYDYPVLRRLLDNCGFDILDVGSCSIDTLIISKMVDYSIKGGHSIEAYGERFGLPKIAFSDWSHWSQEMEDYCVRDVDICHRIFNAHRDYIDNPAYAIAINREHSFQLVVNDLHTNGFGFDYSSALSLYKTVEKELEKLDEEIQYAFPPRLKLIREIEPVLTKFGTLHRKDFRWVPDGDLSSFNGGPFCLCKWETFNPSSPKQILDILWDAGWQPKVKTKTRIVNERESRKLNYQNGYLNGLDIDEEVCYDVRQSKEKYGWKICEENLDTLPSTAPPPARLLAHRILLESRRRTLKEWLDLSTADGRIHGEFYGLGSWPQRMAHRKPNTANIPKPFNINGSVKLLGSELRSLWCAPPGRILLGVDADSIQLRVFAHLIDDKEFTEAIVKGDKRDQTDPHSLNKRILGRVCKSRDAAKRFIYALLLGAGIPKLAEILECDIGRAEEALDRLLRRYSGFAELKRTIIPRDAKRGYFIGLDDRRVQIPGDDVGYRKHLTMSGYLQNGEKVIMEHSTLEWYDRLPEYDAILVDLVHDEWQIELPDNMETALELADIVSNSLPTTGKKLKLKCPLLGSYSNDGYKTYTIGYNWTKTH